MWDEKVQQKLVRAKEILEEIITNTDSSSSSGVVWKAEWVEPIRKWSGQIAVYQGSCKNILLRFPLSGQPLQSIFQIVIDAKMQPTTSLSYHFAEGGDSPIFSYDLEDRALMIYRWQANLETIPFNILFWGIHFFVNRLGGTISHKFSTQHAQGKCQNWLFIKPQHRLDRKSVV